MKTKDNTNIKSNVIKILATLFRYTNKLGMVITYSSLKSIRRCNVPVGRADAERWARGTATAPAGALGRRAERKAVAAAAPARPSPLPLPLPLPRPCPLRAASSAAARDTQTALAPLPAPSGIHQGLFKLNTHRTAEGLSSVWCCSHTATKISPLHYVPTPSRPGAFPCVLCLSCCVIYIHIRLFFKTYLNFEHTMSSSSDTLESDDYPLKTQS